MRLSDKVHQLVHQHLEQILDNPFMVFATDLVYFLSCENGTRWFPYSFCRQHRLPAPRFHTPHPLSPCTNNIRRAMKITLRESEKQFQETYNSIVPDGTEEKLSRFIEHAMECVAKFFAGNLDYHCMFAILQYVARMGVLFHQKGTPDAAHLATTIVADVLWKLSLDDEPAQLFYILDYCAREILQMHALKKQKL